MPGYLSALSRALLRSDNLSRNSCILFVSVRCVTKRVSGHFVTLIEVARHLVECNIAHICCFYERHLQFASRVYLQPVKADLSHISGDFLAENGGSLQQCVRLSRLQKLQVSFDFSRQP